MAQEYKVVIRDKARADIDNIFLYYYYRSLNLEVAQGVVNRILSTAFGLSFMPYTRPIIQELNDKTHRKVICGDFVIPFIINDAKQEIWVTDVFHGKSNYQQYL